MSWRLAIGTLMVAPLLIAGCHGARNAGPETSVEGVVRYAEEYLKAGQPAKAAELYAKANSQRSTPRQRQREALAWLACGKPTEAERVLKQDGPNGSGNWHLLMAVVKLNQGDALSADGHVDSYLGEYPTDKAGLALKAETAYQIGKIGSAIGALKSVDGLLQDAEPLKKTVLYNLALLQFGQGAFHEANATFSRYLLLPGQGGHKDNLLAGIMSYGARDHERAVEFWQSESGEVKKKLASMLSDEAELYATLMP